MFLPEGAKEPQMKMKPLWLDTAPVTSAPCFRRPSSAVQYKCCLCQVLDMLSVVSK